MNLKLSAVLIFLISVLSCKKHDDIPVNPPSDPDVIAKENDRLSAAITNQTATAYISGTIMDEDGKVLSGVSVVAGNITITTNDKGYFQFPGSITVNKDYAIITAVLNGYFKAIKTFTPNASGKANHYFEIKLLKTGAEKTVAASGGNVVVDNKIDLTFPDAAVVTSAGAVYNDQYRVIARYIDPASSSFLETMPGLLSGLNDQNQIQALQSFGMAVVELKDASGNPLQIAPGKTVVLKLPASANSPATIPLWHFNEKYGIWIKAGTATKSGSIYAAEVNHFSIWNLDLELNGFNLDLQFKDQQNNALAGLHAEVLLNGENKILSFFTDNEGKATLINCPASQSITIKTIFRCDTTIKILNPVTADRFELITVPDGPSLQSYTITGKLSGCDNAALANQSFNIAIQGDGRSLGLPGVTDAQGNYSVTGMICNNGSTITVQAIAFVNSEYRYAPAINLASTNSAYNAIICDTISGIADNFEILFPDPVLDSLIRAKIKKPSGTILYGDVKNIDTISRSVVDGSNISNISGIEFCTNLKVLSLGKTNFSDLGMLKNLLSLQEFVILDAGSGLITDVSSLQNLTQMQRLDLRCPILADISPLGGLTQITSLNLETPLLSDLAPLQYLKQLNKLEIYSRALTTNDLNILQNFSQLTHLGISGTSISDFSVVQNLPQLKTLGLRINQISDLNQISSLTGLTTLRLNDNKIEDISALQAMTQLQILDLSYNQITNISSLQGMTHLDFLSLSYNQITDISALQNAALARFIQLNSNKISDLTPLQNLNNLDVIWLNQNDVTNISPLINGVPKLQFLSLFAQRPGKISQSQQDAFKNSHPNCSVSW